MTSSPGPAAPGPVRPLAALAYGTAGFVALVIAGFGLTSLVTDTEVIAVPGLGALPGAAGVVAATAAFVAVTWLIVRSARPAYGATAAVIPAVLLAHLAGVWLGAIVVGTDPARAAAAAGGFAISPFAAVLLASAFVCAWAAVALVRTRASRPRWPWEGEDEDA
ncbi:DUF6121 family protein [Microbacterium sp. PA5]|uniref:DUF6121 family protein n=1 Tax=Microbacterium sp. PA5 TaxID=3416654 RepID=UPI003CF57E81